MKTIGIMALLLGLVLLAGCSNVVDTTPAEPDTPKLNLVVTSVGFNPIFYPLDQEKIPMPGSVDIKLVKTSYNQAELYTLSTKGTPTVGVLSGVNVAMAANNGQAYKILAPYYREIVGPDGYSVGQVVTLKDSNINSPKDFEGKTIGIQGETDGSTLIMKTVLQKVYQVDLSKIEFIGIDSENAPALLSKGSVDAAMFDSDFIIASDFDAKYKTALDFGKEMKEFYGVVPPAKFFVARADEYAQNPQIYNDAVFYFKQNYIWSKNNLEEITRLEADASGDDYSFLLEKAQYETRLDSLSEADKFAWKAILETAVEEGVLDSVPELDSIFG